MSAGERRRVGAWGGQRGAVPAAGPLQRERLGRPHVLRGTVPPLGVLRRRSDGARGREALRVQPGARDAEQGLERIDLLKINVEKSELNVLRGLGPEDWPKIRQLVIEVDLQENLAPITALLEGHGFEVLVEQDPLLRKTELCYVYAIRPSVGHAGRLLRHESPR